jgi:hypothetical protein
MTLLARGLILAEEVRKPDTEPDTEIPKLDTDTENPKFQTGYRKPETGYTRNKLPKTHRSKTETRADDAAGARANPC